jgi:uncharacterized protein (TIGR02266 family)
MEKRVAKRILSRVKALFGAKAPEHLGFALNLSSSGLFLSSTRLLPPRTELTVRLEPLNVAPIEVRGHVRWGLQVPPNLVTVVKPDMGIQLQDPPREYVDFFSSLLKKAKPLRASPRVDARLEVRFYHRNHFLKVYTENISRGGLFIATDEAVERGSEVVIDLVIPDLGEVWHVTGRVAYHLDTETARHLESQPGIGIEITEADPRVREAFQAYVERIRRFSG